MDYLKHYNLLIERGKNRVNLGYMENHHIIPKCLGGSDDKENLVKLTPEEHYLAHLLLVRIYPKCNPLISAAVMMTVHNTNYRVNNKLYGWLRRRASDVRKQHIAEHGHPRGMLGKKHTAESNERRSASCKAAMIDSVGVKVYVYNLDGSFFKEYETLTDCADALDTTPSNVKYTAEGKFSHCKGKQISYFFVESMPPRKSRLAGIKKQQYVCPHCNKKGAGPVMKRFHFDNCKKKRMD